MKLPVKVLRALVTSILVSVVLAVGATAAGPKFDSLYVFGDSLADNGNLWLTTLAFQINPAPPPSISPHRAYFKGRFSNGPVSFEYLWQQLSGQAPGTNNGLRPFVQFPQVAQTGAVDFAFGGSGSSFIGQTPGGQWVPGVKGQIELFRFALAGKKPSKRAVYAIVTGANDYQQNPPMAPSDVVKNIADAVVSLYQLGARNVLVLNLPDLGLLPANRANPGPATLLSQIHNTLLKEAMDATAAQLTDLNLIQIDLNQVFGLLPPTMDPVTPALDALLPPPFPPPFPPGFVMSSCLFVDPALCADVPTFDVGQQFVFWDIVHPTTAAHRVLGDFMYQALVH
jgi:phospholipase/lecithinase/hemolysin